MTGSSSRIFQGIVVFSSVMFLAVWLGVSIVTNQTETLLQLVGAIVLIVCLALGRRIWLLIPFTATLDITLRLPGLPNSLLLAQVLVLGFSTVFFLMRKLPFQLVFSELEFIMLALIIIVLQVYLRHPVGVSFFGSDNVGGRPYFLFGLICISSLLLCGLRIPPSQLSAVFKVSMIGGILNGVIGALGYFIPAVGYITTASYAPSDANSVGAAIDSSAANRIGFLTNLSKNLALWLSCFISPVAALAHPLWSTLLFLSVAASAMSGYRSCTIVVVTTLMLGTIYRGSRNHLIFGLFGSATALALLALTNVMHPLPPNIQRSLTFLPGTWEERYKDDADSSTEWRVEIWKEVLLTDRWIQNKLLGDGLGFTAAELAYQTSLQDNSRKVVNVSGFDAQRDAILSNGDYHSTAVNTIRTCGYAGLAVLVLAMLRLSVHAYRLILRCRGTPWYTLSLFLAIPQIASTILLPVSSNNFLQVASAMFLNLALIRLAQNNIDFGASQTQQPAKNA